MQALGSSGLAAKFIVQPPGSHTLQGLGWLTRLEPYICGLAPSHFYFHKFLKLAIHILLLQELQLKPSASNSRKRLIPPTRTITSSKPITLKLIAISSAKMSSSEKRILASESSEVVMVSPSFDIEFRNLKFSVPGKEILKGVSGYCKSGRILAILGQSGAGKSTVRDYIGGAMRLFEFLAYRLGPNATASNFS